jgi:hypothetical protein
MMNVSKKIITKECELQVGGITKKFSKKKCIQKRVCIAVILKRSQQPQIDITSQSIRPF